MKARNLKFWQPMIHPAATHKTSPKIICAGEGVEVTDIDGHRTLDAVGGLWNVNLGYSCQPIKDAITEQLETLPYYSSFPGVATDKAIELSHALADWFAEDGMQRAFYTSGGSDAVETALRLARQYHKIRGDKDRYKFISLKKGYHGTHFGGASIGGNAKNRRNYEPLLPGCHQIASPWPYRNPFNESNPEILAQLCANMLEDEIKFQGGDTVAAFIMEPVQGSGGVIVPHKTFMPMVREICDRHGVLLIADEVITAFGRTGAWTGSRLWNTKPDMMCTAKGISNGYYPFGATMLGETVVEAFESNSDSLGEIGHGYTYSGHPVGAAAALATLQQLAVTDVATNSAARGAELSAGLKILMAKHDCVGDIRGIGLMQVLELVSDRSSKMPLGKNLMTAISEAIYREGVTVRVSGNNIILSPPLIINAGHVETIIKAIDVGLGSIQ
ncbi:MAG: aminotransferase class III-fold pyridoxal phosphate-dependent enzyme [Porticoccaceae bacterium]|jgi:adenosylmethionine-8-amino-7-oxononanoate aminotransferase|nr:aminotransferase class III-fold pyridoxal phosphate-dependent enzyme [Porticoccaceae bacterium]MBT6799710.1 aminotransferase class III-fold pyridoxal phosphate-dependent enzyme [Porticoccaceae bacterium]